MSRIHEWISFYNCERTEQRSPPQSVPLLSSRMRCLRNVHEPSPSKMGKSVSGSTIAAFRRCLAKRCSATDCCSLSRKCVVTSRCLSVESSVMLTIDSQVASPHLGLTARFLLTVRRLRVCRFGAISLTRGRVCRLLLLLALASAVILGSESHGASDYVLLSEAEWKSSGPRV
jgi:hypothetical protein